MDRDQNQPKVKSFFFELSDGVKLIAGGGNSGHRLILKSFDLKSLD